MKAIAHLEPSVGSWGRRPERPRAITKKSTFGVLPVSSPSEIPPVAHPDCPAPCVAKHTDTSAPRTGVIGRRLPNRHRSAGALMEADDLESDSASL